MKRYVRKFNEGNPYPYLTDAIKKYNLGNLKEYDYEQLINDLLDYINTSKIKITGWVKDSVRKYNLGNLKKYDYEQLINDLITIAKL